MEHDDRVRRLNILLGALPVQAEIGDTENQLDQWECALVRAAAEITGLTAGVADGVAGYLEGKEADATPLALFTCTNLLHRYAKLAK